MSPVDIAACFGPYRPDVWTPARAIENLEQKLSEAVFRDDLTALVPEWPADYDIESAAEAARAVIEAVGA